MTDFNPGASALAPSTPQATPPQVRQVAPNVYMTGFTDDSVKKYDFELYSGRADYTDRIYILAPDSIVRARMHYHDKLKGGVICNSVYTLSPDGKSEALTEERNCCKWLGTPQDRWAALVLHYGTDKTGMQFTQPFSYALKLWRFGKDKYITLRDIHKDWPLHKHDLSVKCTEAEYQRLQIGAKPDCVFLHPNFPAPVKSAIETWMQASIPKLPNELGGRAVPDGELQRMVTEAGILSGTPGGGPVMTPQDAPMANFGDIIGQVTGRS